MHYNLSNNSDINTPPTQGLGPRSKRTARAIPESENSTPQSGRGRYSRTAADARIRNPETLQNPSIEVGFKHALQSAAWLGSLGVLGRGCFSFFPCSKFLGLGIGVIGQLWEYVLRDISGDWGVGFLWVGICSRSVNLGYWILMIIVDI